MDTLIDNIRNSKYLSRQQIQLLEAAGIPVIDPSFEDGTLKNILQYYSISPEEMDVELHKYAARLLTEGKVDEAWQVLLTSTTV
jgi:hypothetical protein